MKKALFVILTAITCLVLLCGCGDDDYEKVSFSNDRDTVLTTSDAVTTPDAPQSSGSVTVESEDSKYYLTLPISGDRLRVSEDQLAAIEKVTPQMIENAERAILEQLEEYSDSQGGMYFGNDAQGYLCLQAELIVDINPPKIRIQDGEIVSSGCNIDHKHVFFSQRIE